jgi:2-haloacid dehalogenase
MTFEPGDVETVTVDSYGTLVDPSAVEGALAEHVEAVESISEQWRSRSLMYTVVANYTDAYRPFYDVNRDALRYALESHGVDLPAETIEDVLSTYHNLDPFDDVREGLEALTDAGYDVYVVSNGNPEMLESMVEAAAIEDVVADLISAHEIRTFKPDVEVYRNAAARTGTPIDAIAHVAGPTFDVQGAKHAGMQGVWLDRGKGPWDPSVEEPDLVVETFADFADVLRA